MDERSPDPSRSTSSSPAAPARSQPAVTWVSRAEGLSLRAVEFALRDEEDLAHNARRLVSVVDSLAEELEGVVVYAEPPTLHAPPSAGWLSALDELAAREVHLKLRDVDATALEAALDRELPFKCVGAVDHRFVQVLAATRASLDGATTAEVQEVLDQADPSELAERLLERPRPGRAHPPLVRVLQRRLRAGGPRGPRRAGAAVSDRNGGFGLDHLPYGVYSRPGHGPRVGVRLGDSVVDARSVTGIDEMLLGDLTAFMALGPDAWREARAALVASAADAEQIPLDEVTLHLPFQVADYVDFYCSLQHATNVGQIFRPDSEPLTPNWRHLPIGYHGRAGTVVVSGTDVVRPRGQRKETGDPAPTYGPSRRLDIEAELGFVVGVPSRQGEQVPTSAFADHVFGVTLLNDWSARDIQAWEYVPLGPFLGKSFATSISPWVTPLAALEAARAPLPGQDPQPLPYLAVEEPAGFDIDYEIVLNGEVVSRPPYASMYWSPAQMLAHLTVNGASLRTGDLFASGTISGEAPEQRGSFLELSWGGTGAVRRRAHVPRGRRRGGPARQRPRHRRRADHPRRGERPGAAGDHLKFPRLRTQT